MLTSKTCIISIEEKKSHLTASDMSLTYIKNKSGHKYNLEVRRKIHMQVVKNYFPN